MMASACFVPGPPRSGPVSSLVFAWLVCVSTPMLAQSNESGVAVVVGHNMAPAEHVSSTLVLGMFAKKRLLWSDHSVVVPVNLPASHPLRRAFSQSVFKKTPEQLQDYWNDQYFHGVLPPPVLASEEAVLRFVASTPGAVGYVASCSVDKRVDVIALIQVAESEMACAH